MNLSQTFRESVEATSQAVSDTFDFMMAKINALWNVQHTPTGGHKDITATSLTVTKGTVQDIAAGTATGNVNANGAGPHAFGGDIIAEYLSGTETGIGVLSTVNGVSLIAGLVGRHGLLFGGVTTGYFLVKAGKNAAFGGGGTSSWRWYDLENAPGTAPMLQMAQDIGGYSIIDGGTGSTRVNIGNANRPMLAVYADDVFIGGGAAIGNWTTPTFAAGDYTGGGGWTVQAGDRVTAAYEVTDKKMTYSTVLVTTSVTGGAPTLLIAIPGGFTAAKQMSNAAAILSDNGVVTTGNVTVAAAGTSFQIQRTDGANWAAAVNTTTVVFQITFEVQ